MQANLEHKATRTATTRCDACKGTGQQDCKVTEIDGQTGARKESSVRMKCFDCEGRGRMTRARRTVIEREWAIWCRCATQSDEPEFYDDDEHHEIRKHHWRCPACKKVVQIG